jgi:serine/threonine-protein kinase
MSQHTQHPHSDRLQTLHGFGHEAESPLIGEPGESRFVPIGARVGHGGQVFETDGGTSRGGFVVKLFTWGADLPELVVQEFTREVMMVANLRHPHVVQVVDAGRLGDGTPFVVMERLAGMTLEEAVSGRPLPMVDVLPILRGVAAALSAAHAAGISHNDVRADNIFIAEALGSGRVCPKMLDFGVARLAAGGRGMGWNERDAVSGAAAWSRPELGARAAERADQLSLAMLTRRLLGGMAAATVDRVLSRAMSPDPSQRFGTVAAFIAALEDAILGRPAGTTRDAAAVTMPVGAGVRVSASHPVLVASPIHLSVARARPVVPPPGIASSPSSLTQQFFDQGEQLEMAHAANQAPARAAVDDDNDGELESAVLARVPRSRAQMILAALLAVGSVAVIGSTVVSLADKPGNGSQVAELSRPAAVIPPTAISTPRAQVQPGATGRGPQRTAAVTHRALRGRPAPSPTTPAALRPAEVVNTPNAPAAPAATGPIEAPPPQPPTVTPSEAAAPAGDPATPDPPPAASSNEAAPAPDAPDDDSTAPSSPSD